MARILQESKNLPPDLVFGGSADIPLFGGASKTPDASIYHRANIGGKGTSDKSSYCDAALALPTVMFETAFSQTLEDVTDKAIRAIGGSLGGIQLVVILKLPYTPPGNRTITDNVNVDFWEVTFAENVNQPYGGKVGTPFESGVGPTAASNFKYSEQDKEGFTCLTISRTKHHTVIYNFTIY